MHAHALGASQAYFSSQLYFVTGNFGTGTFCSVPCSQLSVLLQSPTGGFGHDAEQRVVLRSNIWTHRRINFFYFLTLKIVLTDTHLCIRFEDESGSLHQAC